MLSQRDFWDSVNLQPGGGYAAVDKSQGLLDLLGQLAPAKEGAQQASSRELPYVLLRRVAPKDGSPGYEVRRYPQTVSVCTSYFQRIDAFGTLGAYTNGANEAERELLPYVPSLMSVRQDGRSMAQIKDDSLDLKPSDERKAMRWPMAVPALGDATPPKPAGQLDGIASLQLVPTRVVGVLGFSDPTTEPTVRGYHGLLCSLLRRDGLEPSDGEEAEQFRLAQFDALNSLGARRSEVWVDLAEHPWQ